MRSLRLCDSCDSKNLVDIKAFCLLYFIKSQAQCSRRSTSLLQKKFLSWKSYKKQNMYFFTLNSLIGMKIKSLIESEILKFKSLWNINSIWYVSIIIRSCLYSRVLYIFTAFFNLKTIEILDFLKIFLMKNVRAIKYFKKYINDISIKVNIMNF